MTRKKRKSKFKRLLYWIPVILWMAVIFKASSQPYEDQDLRPMLDQYAPKATVEKYLGDVKVNYAGREISIEQRGVPAFLEFFIRKGAHIFVFMMLAILIQWVVQKTWLRGFRSYAFTLIVTFLYACSDEWHQSFNPNRTAKLSDVGIDMVGVFIGLAFIFAINTWNRFQQRIR
ncbi:hypothetical protein BEP19_13080 [Ammoniphilus oxalaticus]|uniref:VanZ-like domain-containing protein n=1 Tax=Ammoniphilus oxalaticus TaxID=66863 RepID=A0A419SHD5_9BACL|nr:VanZ family protein [Ammoniphilus oxalaticus]RKD23145.1 hypothetical protein BEP19_13080 [Ammoniphilus oxalaticus]